MSDVGAFLLMFAVLAILVGIIRFLAWLTELQEQHGSLPRAAGHAVQRYVVVNRYQNSDTRVMSRSDDDNPPSLASSLETDARQTPDAPETPRPKAEEYLTLCKLMRRAGVKREDAQAAFEACGMPFNNNVWTKAKPVEDDDVLITPYAGRRTRASYYPDDPELEYQSPRG